MTPYPELHMSSCWRAGVALLVLLGLPSTARAQATGAITGLVTDQSGGVVPGATIEATSEMTGLVRHTVTADDGFFTIPLLAPGTYHVAAGAPGFQTSNRPGIQVLVNETARIDLTLYAGGLIDFVDVVAPASL